MKLKTKKLGSKWWITGDEDFGHYGPYDTKKEAEDDRIGLVRTQRNINNPEYFTSKNISLQGDVL